jgi:hypothetical protein
VVGRNASLLHYYKSTKTDSIETLAIETRKWRENDERQRQKNVSDLVVNFKHGCFSLGSRISRGKTVKEPWQNRKLLTRACVKGARELLTHACDKCILKSTFSLPPFLCLAHNVTLSLSLSLSCTHTYTLYSILWENLKYVSLHLVDRSMIRILQDPRNHCGCSVLPLSDDLGIFPNKSSEV